MYLLQSFPEDFWGAPIWRNEQTPNTKGTGTNGRARHGKLGESLAGGTRLCPTLGGKSFLMTMKMIHPSCFLSFIRSIFTNVYSDRKRDTIFARFPLSEKDHGKA